MLDNTSGPAFLLSILLEISRKVKLFNAGIFPEFMLNGPAETVHLWVCSFVDPLPD
jgi:hypothetical protein